MKRVYEAHLTSKHSRKPSPTLYVAWFGLPLPVAAFANRASFAPCANGERLIPNLLTSKIFEVFSRARLDGTCPGRGDGLFARTRDHRVETSREIGDAKSRSIHERLRGARSECDQARCHFTTSRPVVRFAARRCPSAGASCTLMRIEPVIAANRSIASGASADACVLAPAIGLPLSGEGYSQQHNMRLRAPPKRLPMERFSHGSVLTCSIPPKNLTVTQSNVSARHPLMPHLDRISPKSPPEKPHPYRFGCSRFPILSLPENSHLCRCRRKISNISMG